MTYLRIIAIFITFVTSVFAVSCIEINPPNYDDKLQLLVKSPALHNYFEIDNQGIKIYSSPSAKDNDSCEIIIYHTETKDFTQLFRQLSSDSLLHLYQNKGSRLLSEVYPVQLLDNSLAFPPATPAQPLQGVRIAIDPGHIAGNEKDARLEHRFMQVTDSGRFFYEAQLNFATARFLQQALEKQGANVLLTRQRHGHTAFDKTYSQWVENDLENAVNKAFERGDISEGTAAFLTDSASAEEVFHQFFKFLDYKERARKINAFGPHLSLMIHYNVSDKAVVGKSGNYEPVNENYSMVFVPGSFMQLELDQPKKRLAFLRLLITNDLYQSIDFSATIAQHLESELNVPLIPNQQQISYLNNFSIFTGRPGVYARNLAMTRQVRGCLCFGETFYQNNSDESLRLSENDTVVDGMAVPKRCYEVAQAYYSGIMEYVKNTRQAEETQ